MSIIYFDTETTSLRPGQICQLAYLIEDKYSILSKNFYFAVDDMDIGASRVSGLTVPILDILSKGKVMGDHIEEIDNDFGAADLLIAHNFNFDHTFLQAEFERHDRVFCYRDRFCSMRGLKTRLCLYNKYGGYKNPSLEELGNSYGVSEEEVSSFLYEQFGAEARAHDARYDTSKLYLALDKAKRVHADLNELIMSKL